MESVPEIILIIEPGTKKGVTLRGPDALICSAVSSIVVIPPIPEPTATPNRSASKPLSCNPESSSA